MPLVADSSWEARLRLELALRRGGTVLARAEHEGPLRVQRAFYPEGPTGPCHVYVLHPPGGIVSGDRLLLDVQLAAGTRALLTAPGAMKLYRARGEATASLLQRFTVGQGACLEWLPPETIAFEGTRAQVATHVELAADATYAGWDILCLGRPAAGERFRRGQLTTDLSVSRAGKLTYVERGRYHGGSPLLHAPWGMSGQPVLGTMLVAAPHIEQAWVERVREHLDERVREHLDERLREHLDERVREHLDEPVTRDGGRFAVTLVSGVLIVRYLGASTREARVLFEHAYGVLRPLYAGQSAVHPRIWST